MNQDFDTLKKQITSLWRSGDYNDKRKVVQKITAVYGQENLQAVLANYNYETQDDILRDAKQGIQANWYEIQASLEGNVSEISQDIDNFCEVSQCDVGGIHTKLDQVQDLCNDPTPIWDVDEFKPLQTQQIITVLGTLEKHITSLARFQNTISEMWDERGEYQAAKIVSDTFDDLNDTGDYMSTFAYQCDIELGADEYADAIQYLSGYLEANLSAIDDEDPDIRPYDGKEVAELNRHLSRMLKKPAMFYLYPKINEDDEPDLTKPTPITKGDLLYLVCNLAYGDEDVDMDAWLKEILDRNK